MALTAQQHLDLIDSVIQGRLNGDAYQGYTAPGAKQFQGASLKDLYAIRADLVDAVAAEGGTAFALAEPFEE